ncbi:hypothetical protein BASA81_003251 [Batrachochytrium salamandrivorans]|nr:hypothetical protein BASA81_003251 [Batrachochytrium salamandrivorans]
MKNRYIGEAHAVVAMIFRPRVPLSLSVASPAAHDQDWQSPPIPLHECELFFILRATNPKDRWSGQVAFPGGRKKSLQESDLDCAKRETMEEVGMDISNFTLLGRTHDRVLLQRNKKLVVSCLVFFAHSLTESQCGRVEPSEVAACGWCPVAHFQRPKREILTSMQLPVNTSNAVVSSLLTAFGVRNLVFTKCKLPVQVVMTTGEGEFHLWGLTLGLVNEILLDQRICDSPLNQMSTTVVPFFPNDRIFDSPMHNLLYGAWKQVMPPMDFMFGIQSYVVALTVLGPSSLLLAGTGMFKLLAKL